MIRLSPIWAWAILPLFSISAQAGETLVTIDLTQVEVRRGETCWQRAACIQKNRLTDRKAMGCKRDDCRAGVGDSACSNRPMLRRPSTE